MGTEKQRCKTKLDSKQNFSFRISSRISFNVSIISDTNSIFVCQKCDNHGQKCKFYCFVTSLVKYNIYHQQHIRISICVYCGLWISLGLYCHILDFYWCILRL
ncbi:hypothetical protein GDO86_009255 [Hymenochirus boettgeri]|uniref:Uncharacterized protein n=1 Tax=Hymenochirus boettgeri TaxID=247094 RepID=A0A8T2JFR0_9PIPI|nr:hypothetical protein GDO86_009255 [Hymenochirus boettgeri]